MPDTEQYTAPQPVQVTSPYIDSLNEPLQLPSAPHHAYWIGNASLAYPFNAPPVLAGFGMRTLIPWIIANTLWQLIVMELTQTQVVQLYFQSGYVEISVNGCS